MRMKKISRVIKKSILLTLICSFCAGLLTGCGNGEHIDTINAVLRKIKKIIYDDDQYSHNAGNYIDARIESIINAANDDDADALYDMFGSNIVDINENLYEEAEAFVDAIDGEFISNKVIYETESASSKDHDGIKTQIQIIEEVETSTGKYVINFIDNAEVYDDTLKGMQSLGIQEYDDYDEDPCFAPDYSGIYVVTPDNHDTIEKLEDEGYTSEFTAIEKRILEEAGVDAESPDDLTTFQMADVEAMADMLEYAESKYGQTFLYMGYIEPYNLEGQEEEMYLVAEGDDIHTDVFSVKRDGDGFTDDYMCIVVRGQTERYIQNYVSELANGADVQVFAEVSDTTITDKTFSDDEIPGNVNASCMIFVDGADVSDAIAQKLPEEVETWLCNQKIYGLNQLVVLNEDLIDEIWRENYTDYLDDEYYSVREDCDAQE